MKSHRSYWDDIWSRYYSQPLGVIGASVVGIIIFVALYAPFLASSKPIVIVFDGSCYFPLFRYLFSSVFYTKKIDLFFNVVALWLPLFLICRWLPSYIRNISQSIITLLSLILFIYCSIWTVIDPAIDIQLNKEKQKAFENLMKEGLPTTNFSFELSYMNTYARLNLILYRLNIEERHNEIVRHLGSTEEVRTLYSDEVRERKERKLSGSQQELAYIGEKEAYIESGKKKISFILYPFIDHHHWEEDIGGDERENRSLPFYALSRLGRQDLLSALIFGARISLFVGFAATMLSLLIGIPLGLLSGYFGGRLDILLCRFIEVWESMPAFFMLLLIVTLLQSKSIFLIIAVIAIFSWPSTFRYVRAETFRQRELSYIEAAHALGFPRRKILFSHLLANCIVPVVALLPFDIMGAITREAGLAFLGLGEEHSCSWGVLMDEGRAAFPQESALLFPPAIALTILLVAIAFVGQALQKALDPKASRL